MDTVKFKQRKQLIWEDSNGKCFYCDLALSVLEFTIDHVIPVSKGGTNQTENLVVSCSVCNETKADVIPSQDVVTRASNRPIVKELKAKANQRTKDYLDGLKRNLGGSGIA